jgi:DNA-binding NarL/FixJ family response regulator
MPGRTAVRVHASDALVHAGLTAQLRPRFELDLLEGDEETRAEVVIVAADTVDESALRAVRAVRGDRARVVLVVRDLDDAGVLAAVEAGAVAIVRSRDATPERLTSVVCAARVGEGTVPPDMLGRLLAQVRDVQQHVLAPRGLTLTGMSERELDVLRLVADGFDTREIASELAYSERTIKNLIQDITRRFGLRNRSHAVAYALRHGLI